MSTVDKVFNDLQDSMEEKASIYKDTQFDPLYQFICGNLGWEETVDQISESFASPTKNP